MIIFLSDGDLTLVRYCQRLEFLLTTILQSLSNVNNDYNPDIEWTTFPMNLLQYLSVLSYIECINFVIDVNQHLTTAQENGYYPYKISILNTNYLLLL